MRIIIGAVLSLPPFSPGMAWNWMHLAVGLRRLGHDVHYLEEVEPEWCVDTRGNRCDLEHSVNRERFQATTRRFGLHGRAHQIQRGDLAAPGGPLESLLAEQPDLLINMAGHVKSPRVLCSVARRVYVDQDPVFTQLWYAEYGHELNFGMHDVFVSVGLNIGTPRSCIPDCGIEWHHTLPPVVLDDWAFHLDPACRRFTTLASWAGYGDVCYRGEWHGSKDEEFERFAELPRRAGQEFEIALRRHFDGERGIRVLRDAGWSLTRAEDIASLSAYQAYIARSRAEIGIAKNAYVRARSGWFSDRSAHYLASGKPVLAQSTGFEHCLPTGRGLLTFGTMDEAVAGVEAINGDYVSHCRAAREFAEEYLDHRRVLSALLDACMARPRARSSERRDAIEAHRIATTREPARRTAHTNEHREQREQLGPPELHEVLQQLFGDGGTVQPLEHHRLGSGVYRLHIAVKGSVRSVVIKRLAPDVAQRNQLVAARWLAAIGLRDTGPPLLGVAAERNGRQVWHVYEDLGDRILDERTPDPARVGAAVELIARIHTRFAEHAMLAECRLWGRDLGISGCASNVRDAIRGLEHLDIAKTDLGLTRTTMRDRLLARLHEFRAKEGAWARMVAESGGSETLLHGDLWPKNVLVVPAADGLRARLIDWDRAGVGPVAYDLSTFLSRFPAGDRQWILDAYRQSMARAGCRLPSAAELNVLFTISECARLANLVIWPALAASRDRAAWDWAFADLARLDEWFERLEPVLRIA